MERLVILLPKELKEALAKAAEADRRSMSTYVMMLIEKDLNHGPHPGEKED